MTPEQKTLIRDTWRLVEPIADDAVAMFYARLFELDPTLEPMFAGADMAAQRQKLASALGAVVGALDDVAAIVPTLTVLGRRHADYGVLPHHFDTVGAALLDTLEKGLGDAWSPEAAAAWTEAYGLVAGVMREAAFGADDDTVADVA